MKKRRKPSMKTFTVEFDQMTTTEMTIRARTAGEARRKAWKKWRPRRKDFTLWADRIDE